MRQWLSENYPGRWNGLEREAPASWSCGVEFIFQTKERMRPEFVNVCEFFSHAEVYCVSEHTETVSSTSRNKANIEIVLIAPLYIFFA
jgi:hypothetical protein